MLKITSTGTCQQCSNGLKCYAHRNFYLTQFEESENLDKTGILEMDLSKLSPLDPDKDSLASLSAGKSEWIEQRCRLQPVVGVVKIVDASYIFGIHMYSELAYVYSVFLLQALNTNIHDAWVMLKLQSIQIQPLSKYQEWVGVGGRVALCVLFLRCCVFNVDCQLCASYYSKTFSDITYRLHDYRWGYT